MLLNTPQMLLNMAHIFLATTQMLLNMVHSLLTIAQMLLNMIHTLPSTTQILLYSTHIFSRYLTLHKKWDRFLSCFTYHDSYLTDHDSYLLDPPPELFILTWPPPWNIHILLTTTSHILLNILNSYLPVPSHMKQGIPKWGIW